MKILNNKKEKGLIINLSENQQIDLGWQDNLEVLIEEKLDEVVNPITNFETKRIVHTPYNFEKEGINLMICDIWYEFFFYDTNGNYVQEYSPIGLTITENIKQLREVNKSFFKLEFFKTRNNEKPNRSNRLLVFSKMLSIPLGERYFYSNMNDTIYRPTFTGNNVRNKENMYLYWFEDEGSVLENDYLGDDFWVTAKFFNSDNGDIYDFTNKIKTANDVEESDDLYYKLKLVDGKYIINNMEGLRRGLPDNPIKFYQKK